MKKVASIKMNFALNQETVASIKINCALNQEKLESCQEILCF